MRRKVMIIALTTILFLCVVDCAEVLSVDWLTPEEIEDGMQLDCCSFFVYDVLSDHSVKLIRYAGIENSVQIPERICDMPVSCIGDYVFHGTAVTEAFLPDIDIAIDEDAFDWFQGTIWIHNNHPTLRCVKAIIHKDTMKVEYCCGLEMEGMPSFRTYVEFND